MVKPAPNRVDKQKIRQLMEEDPKLNAKAIGNILSIDPKAVKAHMDHFNKLDKPSKPEK